MKASAITILTLLLWAIFFPQPNPPGAATREAVLFLDGALVTETKKIRLTTLDRHLQKGEFTLPGTANPLVLTVFLSAGSKLKMEDLTWQVQLIHQEDKLKELRKQLQGIKETRATLRGNIQALDAQILFWQTQAKGRAKNSTEANNLTLAIAKNIRRATADKMLLEPELAKAELRLKQLEEEMKTLLDTPQRRWLVTLLFSGPKAHETTITYSYLATDCGWEPAYRLDARLTSEHLALAREAFIWQRTGQDWHQVDLTLMAGYWRGEAKHTEPPPAEVKPLPDGRSRKRPPDSPKVAPLSEVSPRTEVILPPGKKSDSPSYPLGRLTIPSDAKLKVTIKEENWPARFSHHLNPAASNQSMLTGHISLSEHLEIPGGQAVYFIEGAYLGKRPFSFSGRTGEINLGTDPLVSATTTYLSERGLTAHEDLKTQTYKWKTELRNARNHPVRITLEMIRPQISDGRIQTSVIYQPPPQQEGKTSVRWQSELAASEIKIYRGELIIHIPREMDFLPDPVH